MELHTDRLRLREFMKSDWKAVQRYSGDRETVRFMTWGPNTEKMTKDFIRRTVELNGSYPRKHYDFLLEKRDSGQVVGAVGLYPSGGEAEMGWILHRDYWGCGYMTEAVTALIGFGFSVLGLHRIFASCFLENTGSWRVMEKCGMTREGHFKKKRHFRDDPETWHDELLYAVLDEDAAGGNDT